MIYKLHAKVILKQEIANLIYLICFTLDRPVHFEPGQFLHLTLEEYEPDGGYWPESRVFSIASEPDKNELTIVFSVKGRYTQRMAQELIIGKKIWLKLPYGEFCINNLVDKERSVVLISGGTGISPFIPYLLQSSRQKSKQIVYHFHGVKKFESLFFESDLENIAKNLENFHGNYFIEEPTPFSSVGWTYNSGRLDINKIILLCPDRVKNQGMFFISGPPGMITQFKKDLLCLGIKEENIKMDQWE